MHATQDFMPMNPVGLGLILSRLAGFFSRVLGVVGVPVVCCAGRSVRCVNVSRFVKGGV